jgi:adenine-specific DNA-methyltransferase
MGGSLAPVRVAGFRWNGWQPSAVYAQSGWAVADTYGLLADVDRATPFIEAVHKAEGVKIVYIVTDDDRRFQAAAHRLPKGVEPVRLYEAYLKNFSFVNGE